jgi:hypothetical protein
MIRSLQADDLPFLEEMLCEAAAAYNPEVQAMGKEALLRLAVPRYLANWGREGDVGLVAVTETGRHLGAAWFRHPTEEARYRIRGIRCPGVGNRPGP